MPLKILKADWFPFNETLKDLVASLEGEITQPEWAVLNEAFKTLFGVELSQGGNPSVPPRAVRASTAWDLIAARALLVRLHGHYQNFVDPSELTVGTPEWIVEKALEHKRPQRHLNWRMGTIRTQDFRHQDPETLRSWAILAYSAAEMFLQSLAVSEEKSQNKEEDQMQHLTRDEYTDRLRNLPIENPTPEDMAAICPHLTQEQAVAAFTTGERSNYVACPPIRIKGAFQIVSLSREWIEEIKVWRGDTHVITGTKKHPPRLHSSYASRTPASYADGKSHGDVFAEYAHMEEAIAYAEEHWGDQLILDDWESYIEVYVQDPSDLTEREYPRTKAVVYFTTNRGWNDIINDHSKPESVVINDAIAVATLDPLEAHELRGGRGGYTEYNCAYCSGGLGLSGCKNCGHRFRDDHFRCGWDTPLPQKIVDLLEEQGHVFRRDPKIAQQDETAWWIYRRSQLT